MSDNRVLSTDQIVSANSHDLLVSDMEGEAIMLSINQGKYFALDKVGTAIWDLIQKPVSIREVHKALVEKYNGNPETIKKSLLQYLEILNSKKMISLKNLD